MDRDEIRRLLPDDIDVLLPYLTDEFYEAYGLVCDLLYTGDSAGERIGGNGGSKYGRSTRWFIKDTRAFRLKKEADRWLSQTAAALRRWQAESRSTPEKRLDPASGPSLYPSTRAGSAAGRKVNDARP